MPYHMTYKLIFGFAILVTSQTALAQKVKLSVQNILPVNIIVEETLYEKKSCVNIKCLDTSGIHLGVIRDLNFRDGEIEMDVAGSPIPGNDSSYRGFIGIAFRVQDSLGLAYECIYIRPTNGRARDQLRRNHSTQYVSYPRYPWFRLRAETPGLYESYADLISGQWTHFRIVVNGCIAELYLNGADQPCLIVNDLKLGSGGGGIGLWIGPGTNGYFRSLKIRSR
jgi:hypothetical protein